MINPYELSKSIAIFRTTKIYQVDNEVLKTSELSFLIFIYNFKKDLRAVDLSNYLNCSKAYTTKVVNTLIDNGFLVKKPHEQDKRQSFLVMTEKGEEIVKKNMDKYMETTNYLFNQLGVDKASELKNLLDEATRIIRDFQNK